MLNWKFQGDMVPCLNSTGSTVYLNGTTESCLSEDLLVGHLTAKVAPFSVIFSTFKFWLRKSGDLYMISASYRQPPIASATAALGATPRTRLRAEPAR